MRDILIRNVKIVVHADHAACGITAIILDAVCPPVHKPSTGGVLVVDIQMTGMKGSPLLHMCGRHSPWAARQEGHPGSGLPHINDTAMLILVQSR